MAADSKETLKKGDGLLYPNGAMASSGNDERIVTVLPVPDVRDSRNRPGNGSHDCVELKHRKGIPLECATLSAAGGADGPVEKKTGRKIPIKPFEGTDDAFVHSKRPKSPVGDVRRDSVEALFDVSTGSAYLGLLGALRGEVCIFDFEREREQKTSAQSLPGMPPTSESGSHRSIHSLDWLTRSLAQVR